MTNLKVGDRIRLSTGVMVTVKEVFSFSGSTNSNGVSIKADDTGAVYVLAEVEALGISWELVKPELVEPPVGSAIRFTLIGLGNEACSIAWNLHGEWLAVGGLYEWSSLVEEYGITDYELLRPEKEVVKEVLELLFDNPALSNNSVLREVGRKYEVAV